MRIYLDNAATTPMLPEVIQEMTSAMQKHYGNPSSVHAEGRESRVLIEKARKTVAESLKASPGEIFFTSGGTESNNMAIKCAVRDLGITKIITSPIEHHCVLHAAESVGKTGQATVQYVNLHPETVIDLDHLEELLSDNPEKTLVSLMHANNETGCMIDLKEVADLVKSKGALFHSDTVQSIAHFELNLQEVPVDFVSGAAHKFHGPKGVGFIYIRNAANLKPFIDGGAQERNLRAGTENLYGIIGLAKAMEISMQHLDEHRNHILALQNRLIEKIQAFEPDAYVVGDMREPRLFTVLNISFPKGPYTDMLLFLLDIEGVSVSGGSACSSGSDKGSHVLRAMGQPDDRKAIRFSFSHLNTIDEMDQVASRIEGILQGKGLIAASS